MSRPCGLWAVIRVCSNTVFYSLQPEKKKKSSNSQASDDMWFSQCSTSVSRHVEPPITQASTFCTQRERAREKKFSHTAISEQKQTFVFCSVGNTQPRATRKYTYDRDERVHKCALFSFSDIAKAYAVRRPRKQNCLSSSREYELVLHLATATEQ